MKNNNKVLLDAVSVGQESLAFNVEEYGRVGFQFLADAVTSGQGIFTVDGTIDGSTWMRINTLIANVSNSNSQSLTRVASVVLSTSVSRSSSASISPSASRSPSASTSPSSSISPSLSPSASRSPSASASLSPSASASGSPSSSASPSASLSPSASVSLSPSIQADITSSSLVWLDPFLALKAVRVGLVISGAGRYSAFVQVTE